MKLFFCFAITFIFLSSSFAQTKTWTDADRKYLLEKLSQTRDSVMEETKGLSQAQWNFKESPDRWSINQIVEHLAVWELILQREVSQALLAGERPELIDEKRTDSSVLAFLMEEQVHITTEYTKPFTFTVPMGLGKGEYNLAWFLKMRSECIGFVDSTKSNLRVYLLRPGAASVHQRFITIFGHTNRHLRQIKKVKSDARFPKN